MSDPATCRKFLAFHRCAELKVWTIEEVREIEQRGAAGRCTISYSEHTADRAKFGRTWGRAALKTGAEVRQPGTVPVLRLVWLVKL